MVRSIAVLLFALAFAVGCGDEAVSDTDDADASSSADAGVDMSSDAGQPDDTGAAADMAQAPLLCSPCVADADCAAGGRCVTLFNDESICASPCEAIDDCPASYVCAEIDAETGESQCIPEQLTCVDRCSDVACPPNQTCDPLTGECARPGRLCEVGCLTDSQCGNGPEDRCLGVPGTTDERACFNGCDPESEVRECPADYFCVPLDEENDPGNGVCFPFGGTCVDRCSAVECALGQNCDPITGGCVSAAYGACETGCTSDAECGDQNDVCLNLGINEVPTCWQGCAQNPDGCAPGYECLSITATTLRVCIPTSRDCSLCEGTACFPDAVCNPTDGTCQDLPETCTSGSCGEGLYCDPFQLVCQELGRACSGSSWAVDCDNVVTKCTTQTSGMEGTCEALCVSDADCDDGDSCVDTSVGKLCLGYRDGGAQLCGTAYDRASPVGRPCSPATCLAGANLCENNFGVPGFCTRSCTDDGDCDAGQSCGPGPSGRDVCITEQCACAVDAQLSAELELGLEDGFANLGYSPCTTDFEPQVRAANGFAPLGSTDDEVTTLNAYPFATLGLRQRMALAPTSLRTAWDGATAAAGRPTAGTAVAPNYPGTNSKLAEAVAELVTATGAQPDFVALDAAAATVPGTVQNAVAPYLTAVARAYLARRTALGNSGWNAGTVDTAIAQAPFLFLPGRSGVDTAPDLADPTVAARYAAFPRAELEQIMADLTADLDAARPASALSETGFSFDISTPAGRVVIGDAGVTTHDAVAGPIAVLVDIGGDDVYSGAIGTNASSANGVSLVVDLAGSDTWNYVASPDPNDTADTLASDADGRIPAAGPLFTGNGPVSASTQARQSAARFGVVATLDYGTGADVRRSLRMSQATAIFGAALLFDEAGNDTYESEALSQGSSLGGTALLWDAAGDDSYRVWHAGQGFGTAGGAGFLVDSDGTDSYLAEPGGFQAAGVLYYSPVDRGGSNRNLAQGAGAGVVSGVDGGLGVLHDAAGNDIYSAGTYAQGHGALGGVGFAIDSDGADGWDGRGYVQGTGERHGGGLLVDVAGDDTYNATAAKRQRGQGLGAEGGWGVFYDAAGTDTVNYIAPAGGAGIDGGLGIALFGPGVTTHSATSDASWGYAANTLTTGPLLTAPTRGFFVDEGGSDVYTRPDLSVIVEGASWYQPGMPGLEAGYGADR